MADIELVIKIDEKMYKDIQSRDWKNGAKWFSKEWRAIHNGTPLPKGHGRLIDADAIDGDWVCMRADNYECMRECSCEECSKSIYEHYVDDAPTIIEADRESK